MEPLALLLLLWLGLAIRTVLAHACHPRPAADGAALRWFSRPKPAWVVEEVVRLIALMPTASVRTVAMTFNTLWQERRGETVGKTFVAGVIRAHQLDIVRKRAEIKKRRPWPMERNRVWALDLTYLPDIEQKPIPILGLIDHGTRARLALRDANENHHRGPASAARRDRELRATSGGAD